MKKMIVNIAKIYGFYFSGLVLCTQECPATGSMDDGLYPRMIWFSMPFGSNSRPCRSQLPSIRVARLSARPIWVVYSLWILPSVLSANHCSAGTTTTRHVIVKYSSSEAVVLETLTASQLRNNVRGLVWVCIFNSVKEIPINSLAPGGFECNFKYIIFRLILTINGRDCSCEIALRWLLLDITYDDSTSVHVVAWSREATSRYLSQ